MESSLNIESIFKPSQLMNNELMNNELMNNELMNNELITDHQLIENMIINKNIDIFDVEELNFLRDTIENMSKFNQVEVLRIFKQYNCVTLNENKYGVHVNLTDLKREIIDHLKSYIEYVNAQEYNLNEIERQKETFKNIYFPKDNKDINVKNSKYASAASV